MTPVDFQLTRAPGDSILLSGAVRDLHEAYPGKYRVSVSTPHSAIFKNNPLVHNFLPGSARYSAEPLLTDTMSDSRFCTGHYFHGFLRSFEKSLGVSIPPTVLGGDIHFSPEEKAEVFIDRPYWIVNAGWKNDYVVKRWPVAYFQETVAMLPSITFVQTGDGRHNHPELKGRNVVNMTGVLSLRDFFILVRGSSGVLTTVSMPMHAAAAVPSPRPCVVVAGGRECDVWEHYTGHAYISRVGTFPCCRSGGCRKARFKSRNDGWIHDKALCPHPVGDDVPVGKCMADIKPGEVADAVWRYDQWNER